MNVQFSLPVETGNELETRYKVILRGEGVNGVTTSARNNDKMEVLSRTGEGLPYLTFAGVDFIGMGIYLWKRKIV